MSFEVKKFSSRDAAFDSLSHDVQRWLSAAVLTRNAASIALSGGTTPGPLFERLSTASLDWARTMITLTDDRWVDADDPASNERLVRATLMSGEASAATIVPLKAPGAAPADGLAAVKAGLDAIAFPLDVVIMGMGTDGHCASLFPESPDLQDGLTGAERCAAIRRDDGELARMSLTKSALLDSRQIILLIFGDEKMAVLNAAAKGTSDKLPVSHFLCQDKVPLTVYWAA